MMVWGQQAAKMGQGIMTAVNAVWNTKNNWMTAFITAAYDLGGIMIKSAWLNIWSVKAVVIPKVASAPTAHGTSAGLFNGDSMMTDNSTCNDTTPAVDTPILDEKIARLVTLEVTVTFPPLQPTQHDNIMQEEGPLPLLQHMNESGTATMWLLSYQSKAIATTRLGLLR